MLAKAPTCAPGSMLAPGSIAVLGWIPGSAALRSSNSAAARAKAV
jgi:hypothetical protein